MSIENAVASTDIKHLTRQFYAAKSLIISQQETIKHYSQKDFDTNERRIKALQQSINSEREMNAKLTAEIAGLEKELDELEESREDLIWFTRGEIKGLDPEQTGFIDLRVMKLEQRAKGIEDAVTKLERPDVPLAPSLILNDDLLDYAARLRNQAAKLKEQE